MSTSHSLSEVLEGALLTSEGGESQTRLVAEETISSILALSLDTDGDSESCSISSGDSPEQEAHGTIAETGSSAAADQFPLSAAWQDQHNSELSSRGSETTIVSDAERRTALPTPAWPGSQYADSVTSVYSVLRESSRTLSDEAPDNVSGLVGQTQVTERGYKCSAWQPRIRRRSRPKVLSKAMTEQVLQGGSDRPRAGKRPNALRRPKEVIVIDHVHIHHHHHLYDDAPPPGPSTEAFLSTVAEERARRQAKAEAIVQSPNLDKYAAAGILPRINPKGPQHYSAMAAQAMPSTTSFRARNRGRLAESVNR
ncbi:hypothetical protein FOZ62_019018 [Perkinsus olseni]|uniref:Uncharacterized protein n=1 Tax=Perkinsus olseni TaxID=32597 RepID=A0A7J6RFR6_PEROL|nr:hypothetical protein FOZ62_019018 [Perkinsus olseni]